MRKTVLIASAIAFFAASPVLAADAVVDVVELAAPTTFSWTGGYVGVQAGYAWGDSHADYPLVDFQPAGTVIDPDGGFGGAYVGYNYQFANGFVLGADGDINFADINGVGVFEDTFGPNPTETDSVDVNWTGSLRARAGYAIDRFLPYIAGGVAFAGVDVDASSAFIEYSGSWSETYVGWTLGAGVEYAFTDNIIGRFEYRYTDFGSETFQTADEFGVHEVDLKTNDIRIGIAYKF